MNPLIQYQALTPHVVYLNKEPFELGELRQNKIQYSFRRILPFLEELGKVKFGSQFKIFERNKELLFKLCCYMVRDKEMCRRFDLDLNKGIMLTGPSGIGKTTIMKLLPAITPHRPSFEVISTRKLSIEFNTSGYSLFHQFRSTRVYCFDDLGLELPGHHYGQSCEIMGELLLSRADDFDDQGTLTHLTTNLDISEIEQRYGTRVRTRLKRMVNLLTL